LIFWEDHHDFEGNSFQPARIPPETDIAWKIEPAINVLKGFVDVGQGQGKGDRFSGNFRD
jgi:hypothetical protein